MKKALILFIGGVVIAAIALFCGSIFTNRLIKWVIVGACISTFAHGYNNLNLRLIFSPVIGGGAVVLGWFLGKYIAYTMVVWPLFGLIIGAAELNKIAAAERIKKAIFGFIGGFIGSHFFPFLFFIIFPLIGLPFMAWNIEKMGLILSGGTIALGVALGGKKNE
ncbi:MAG: hypothetical protein A2Z59_08810 [Nitrospinae bacterium RIFCSPLOWO2_02_39_17]|nr:MAG: hypothetical protein A2W53_00535 [Nitrospinae bacterium RIFCSPHIGHO2_02_39_11]OGW06854.1 MAG: hypothetical protein A2Z59_08810 [Nitrospinae bacterium RIFCSPLOWO2_02_39_17]OGW11226.1 MAG: hypothetical protein A2W75_09105 [Nitrospinae bacterium RIFCSPLOWO2_12_39_15]